MARAATAPRIYLCSTEWIGLLKGEPDSARTRDLIDRGKRGHFTIVGSEMLRMEVLGAAGEDLLEEGVKIWSAIDRRVATLVAKYRLERQVAGLEAGDRRTPDLVHVATAVIAEVQAFVSTDAPARKVANSLGLDAYDRRDYPVGELRLDS